MSNGRSNLWRSRNREHTNNLSNISYHKHKHKHVKYKEYIEIYLNKNCKNDKTIN